jgi:hypothetical protein
MADFLRVLAVDPDKKALPVELRDRLEREVQTSSRTFYPATGDAALMLEDLQEIMTALGKAAPELDVTLVYEGTRSWVDIGAWYTRAGEADADVLQLSREMESCVPTRARQSPDVEIELDVDAGQLLDALAHASEDEIEPPLGSVLCLPFGYRTERGLLDAAAEVSRHMVEPEHYLVVRVAGRYYELRLVRDAGASIDPLWPWLSDEPARLLARRALSRPGRSASRPCPSSIMPMSTRSVASPYTTGAARARAASAEDIDTRKPRAYETVLAALTSPENQGPRFADVRRVLYRKLARADVERGAYILVTRLNTEPDEVRETIYDVLSRIDAEPAHRAMVRGYRDERGGVRDRVGKILWRKEGAVELLVREELVPAWLRNPRYAQRIVSLLREECLRVPRKWVAAGPGSLHESIADLLVD